MRGCGAVMPLPCRSLPHGSPGASLPGTLPGSKLLMPTVASATPSSRPPQGSRPIPTSSWPPLLGWHQAPLTTSQLTSSASRLCSPISGVDTIIYPAECLSTFTHVVPHPLEVTSSVLLSVSLHPGMVPVQLPSSPI